MKADFTALFAALTFVFLMVMGANAQESPWPKARPEDVSSVTAIIKASYDAISVPPGQTLNLDRFRSLFLPNAQLVSVGIKNGQPEAHLMTLKEFSEMVIGSIGKAGHVEHEFTEQVQEYGNIANVWSAYESRTTPEDPHVIRGINSIQLFNDGKRWWISGAQWQHERTDMPIPARYLSPQH
jgi:hypothetical protein